MTGEMKYTTIEQQIAALESKGLIFDNRKIAEVVLQRYGYYSIINSYKEPYQVRTDGIKNISEGRGTTFEQIYSIFLLDHNLRNSIMAAMLELEECLRAATADVLAESFGVKHSDYLKFRNFRDRYCANPKFTLNAILGTLHNNTCSDKDPIKYYREHHGIIPPWILLKGTYFSTLINLIKYLKKNEKQKLMRIVLDVPESTEISDDLTTLFQTVLFMCLDYRNAAAHGGRIYNLESKYIAAINITENVVSAFPVLENAKTLTGIHLLIVLISVFKDKQSNRIISKALNEQVNRHLQKYSNDIDILSDCIGISIKSVNYVWINQKTKIFHSSNSCSGMINAKRKAVDEIDLSVYTPCRRCVEIEEDKG